MGTFYKHSSKLFYRECNAARLIARQKLLLHVRLEALPRTFPMLIDLASRRSIRKIARADFAAYPVWEWALNEEETSGLDESFLRPTEHASIAPGLPGQYVVAASATLSDGQVLPACAEVTVGAKRLTVAPLSLFVQDRQLDFAGPETTTVLSHLTGQDGARAVSWSLAVMVDGKAKAPGGTLRRPILAWLAGLFGRRHTPGPVMSSKQGAGISAS
jgi:hypothetical protein